MTKHKGKESVGCDDCNWSGFTIKDGESYATAVLCDCVLGCSECNGTGNILLTNSKGYTSVSPCSKCRVIRRNVRLYNMAGIPKRYSKVLQVDACLDLRGIDGTFQSALKYAKEQFVKKYPTNKGFLLMGPSGTGKTHIAVGTISELTLQYGVQCIFTDFFHLLSDLRQAYSEGTPENEIIQPLVEAQVLVIDELGKGRSNEWELNILDQLISKRYNASRETIATTNYVTREFARSKDDNNEILEFRVGERIASRLFEMCELIHLKGKDYRKEKKKA